MPPRRRLRPAKATEKVKPAEEETTSSGEDYEHQRTLEIINRLSLKYLKSSSKTSPVQRRVTRSSLSLENKSANIYDYDADEDTASDDNSKSSKLQLELSPVKASKSKSKTAGKKSAAQPAGKKRPAKSSSSRAYQPVPVSSKRRRGSGPILKGTSSDHVSAVVKKRKVSWESTSQVDSGVFMSPPSRLSNMSSFTHTSTPSYTEATCTTSTPNEPVKRKSDGSSNSSCFGFSSGIASPQLELSPVKHVLTPRNDLALSSHQSNIYRSTDMGSPNLKVSKLPGRKCKESSEFKLNKSVCTYSKPTPHEVSSVQAKPHIGHGLYDIPIAAPAKRTKLKKEKESIITKRIDDIANRMNAEFDEIEMFELSIEG